MNPTVQLPKERVALLDPSDVEAYLLSHGWEEDRSSPAGQVGTFRYVPDREVTALVPRDRGFRDYTLRVGDVLHTLAVLERRPIWEVLETLVARRGSPAANGPAVPKPKTAGQEPTPRAKKDTS
jgi:hypothetical protein